VTRSVSVSTKLSRKDAQLMENIWKEYGFISNSEAVRSAVRLYINLLSLPPNERLRMFQVINELTAPSSNFNRARRADARRGG
jgi:hypothetical protein